MQPNDKLLTAPEALTYLADVWGFKRSPITLSKWASAGSGPIFRKFGRFRYYAPADLDEWMQSHLGPRKRSIKSPTEDVTPLRKTTREAAEQQPAA